MKKICWEESVHIMHGRDVVVTLANGTSRQREMVQEALNRWWGPLMQMHGPRSAARKDRDLFWRIKAKTSEELRQEFLSIYVPRIRELGLEIPPTRTCATTTRPASGAIPNPTGTSCASVVTGHGPKSQERLDFRRLNHAETAWVREQVLAPRAAVA